VPNPNRILPPPVPDSRIAEEQFLERTPWANPQHPAHGNAIPNNFGTQRQSFDVPPIVSNLNSGPAGTSPPQPLEPPVPQPASPLQPRPQYLPVQAMPQAPPPLGPQRVEVNNPGPDEPERPLTPAFHVLANNQLFKIPIDEIVNPGATTQLHALRPSTSPILRAVSAVEVAIPTPVARPTAMHATFLPPVTADASPPVSATNGLPSFVADSVPAPTGEDIAQVRKGRRTPEQQIVFITDYQNDFNPYKKKARKTPSKDKSSSPRKMPKGKNAAAASGSGSPLGPALPRISNQPSALLPFTASTPVVMDREPPGAGGFRAVNHPEPEPFHGGLPEGSPGKDVDPAMNRQQEQSGRGIVPPIGRLAS
jgi:hypothetical protein